MKEQNAWIDIITKLYRDLHMSDVVMHTSFESDKKRDRILKYFERLERVQKKVVQSKSSSTLAKLKEFYYDMYVIKPENIPDKYLENEEKIRRERGQGYLTEDEKNKLIADIIENQKKSLEPWIDYFLFDEEAKSYEMWEKYWVFQGLLQLGKFDKESFKFSKRDKTTVYPFPPVEREAIFTTIHLMEEYIKDKKGEEEIRAALGSGNFKTLYEYSIKQIMQKGDKNNLNATQGKWVKYNQGSDYNLLRNSLQGYYTGWCTAAGENFAKNQLSGGDFYIYYTLDEHNQPKVPRIAIRMNGHNTIEEIRGIADNQNMEQEMLPILNEKLKEFVDRDKYYKKEYDMQRLTSIDKKVKKGMELDREELEFLYEIHHKIEGFGHERDPRIEEIKQRRNTRKDYALIYDYKEEEIGITLEDFQKGNIKIFIDSLSFQDLTNFKDLNLPKIIVGNLDLEYLVSAECLSSQKTIRGVLNLYCLANAEMLPIYKTIRGILNLYSLTETEGLTLPEIIGGTLNLRSLVNAEGIKFPKIVGGGLYLNSLISARNLVFPEIVRGTLDLRSVTNVQNVRLPKFIGETLDLGSLVIAEGLILPEIVEGTLILRNLISVKGLTFPKTIGGGLDLRSLTETEGLTLPPIMRGTLNLRNLPSAEGIKFPKIIEGNLDLGSIENAEDITLPEIISGNLDLGSLTNAKGLKLPKTIGGTLILNSLTSAKDLVLPEKIGGILNLENLRSAEGLKLPIDFSIEKLYCNESVMNEIKANPEKYYGQAAVKEPKVIVKKLRRN